jgi:predicted site-specific integrase-resolvase
MTTHSGKRLLPIRAMCARYGDVADKTIDRWTAAGILPAPLVINKRRYWDEEELEQRERANMGRKLTGEVTA